MAMHGGGKKSGWLGKGVFWVVVIGLGIVVGGIFGGLYAMAKAKVTTPST